MRSAVQAGYGVGFISRRAVESELAAGTLAEARVRGPRSGARHLDRARRGSRGLERGAGVRRLRPGEASAVIVRWGLERAAGAVLGEPGVDRPLLVAGPRWDALGDSGGGRAGARSRRTGSPFRPTSTGSSRSAAGARSTRPRPRRPRRPAARLRPDHVLGGRVDGILRRAHARPPPGRRRLRSPPRGNRLRPGADARPAAGRERRHRAERARALRRGALPGRAGGGAPRRGRHRPVAAARARGRPRPRGEDAPARGRERRRAGACGARPVPRARDGAGARRPLRSRRTER